MFEWFKTNKTLRLELEYAKEENVFLEDQVAEIMEQLNDQIEISRNPKSALGHIIETGIEWYDYDDLKADQLVNYQNLATQLMNNPVFKNEINFLVNNNAKKALLEPTDHKQLNDIRIATLAFKAIEQRIESIPKPTPEPEPAENPHEGV